MFSETRQLLHEIAREAHERHKKDLEKACKWAIEAFRIKKPILPDDFIEEMREEVVRHCIHNARSHENTGLRDVPLTFEVTPAGTAEPAVPKSKLQPLGAGPGMSVTARPLWRRITLDYNLNGKTLGEMTGREMREWLSQEAKRLDTSLFVFRVVKRAAALLGDDDVGKKVLNDSQLERLSLEAEEESPRMAG